VRGADSRSLLIDPVTYEVRDLYGGDAGDGKEEGGARSNFAPTAVFEPFLITDENGIARVRFSLPDNLTTYRCTAIAVDNGRFGYTEEELQVQQPINVTSLLPDRMRVRDTLSAGVMITNMDRSKQEVSVSVSTSVVEIHGDAKKTVTINPGQTVELTFDFFAEVEGYGEVIFSIQSSILNEDLVAVMFVERPLVSETVTTTGRTIQSETGNTATEGVVLPGFDSVQSGNMELTISATLAAGLKGAMEYLLEYPHGCFEQRASKLMPLVVFSDFVAGLDNDIDNVERTIRWELEYWATSQQEDGGFPFWPESSYRSSFYVSLRIAHIIKLAESRGHQIPLGIDQRKLVAFLARPDEYIKGSDYLMAYSLYVQSLYGVPVHRQVTEMSAGSEDFGISALGFIGLTYHELRLPEKAKEILEYVTRFIKPGTRSIDLTSPNGAAASSFYGNEIEELSLLLMLQIAVSSDGFLTDRIAETILQRQYGGIWRNTSETNWALLSLSNLAEVRDETQPNFVATAAIGEQELFRETYNQPAEMRNRAYDFSSEPLASLPRDVTLPLLFSAEGNGALYYTASLTYELPAETAGARDEGFSVYSVIEELDGTPVKGNILKLGETYRQRVVLSTSRRRSYAALRVPVPSGVEILDTSFATTGEYDNDESGVETYSYFDRPHEMIFQNEVRYYFDRIVPGSAEIVFHFRTTSRGVFPTPPAVAECMYEPEIFGRSRGGLFIIRE
ncbi:MAG: hypothetical protein HN368_23585, partial [Spirochaetales bacterium]|nr:hypothetical protein [Spirochaetales bacterium]